MKQGETVSAEPPNLEMAPEPPAGPMSTSRRVAINTVSNWVSMATQMGVNLFLLAYVLKYLSQEQFGIFRLAVTISLGISYLSFGLEATVLRLASESLAVQAWDRLAEILSVARTLLTGAAAVGLAGTVVISLFLLGVLKVPEADRPAAAVLIQTMSLAAALRLATTVYGGALRVKQRFDLANGVIVGGTLLQAALIIICFEAGWVRMEVLGIARLVTAAGSAVAAIVLAHRLLPQVRLSFKRFTRTALRDVFSFGAWIAVKMVTRMTVEQAAVWMASIVFGMVAVAGLAIPQLASQYLTQIVTGLTATLWPIAAKYALHGERENLARLYRVGTRLTMLMLVPAAIVLVTHGRLLIGYLKPELAWSYYLMLVYVGLFLARAAVIPADHIIMASGSVRQVAISQAIAAGTGIMLGLAAVAWTGWGLYGLVVGLFTPFVIQGLIYLPYRIRVEMGVGFRETFLGCMAGPLVGGAVPLAFGWILVRLWEPANLYWTLLQMVLGAAVYAPVAWWLILSAEERGLMLRIFRRGRPRQPPGGAAEGDRP